MCVPVASCRLAQPGHHARAATLASPRAMMPRKRRQSADEAPLAPATAAAAAKAQKQSGGGCDGGGGGGGPGGTGQEVMAKGWQLATMPKQPTAGYTASGKLLPGGRLNACWAPPVVAISKFYGFARLPPTSLSSRAWPAGAGACDPQPNNHNT